MSYVDIIPLPGLLTDQESTSDNGRQDPRWLRAHGYEWLAYQVFNGPYAATGKPLQLKTRDLQPAKDAGMHAGVWGGFYQRDTFGSDAQAFAQQALARGAEFVIVDAEECSKFTRATRGCKPIIDGLRAGGWNGPVHLTQMGCPVNPRTKDNPTGNDYQCDEQSFLETGGGILPQEYANEDESFSPVHALPYWLACGVPIDRINHMIAVYVGHAGRIDGATWAQILQSVGIGRNFSIFMVEMLEAYDAEGLDHQTTLPVQTPEVSLIDPAKCNADIAKIADSWLSQFTDQKTLSRLRSIKRIATTTDSEWVAVRQDVVDALDYKIAALRADLLTVNAQLDQAHADLAAALARIDAAKQALA